MDTKRFPFLKTIILPIFWIFLIPICGALFAETAIAKSDEMIAQGINYIKIASWLAILLALVAIIFIGIAGAASMRSRDLQLLSLRIGVPALKFVAASEMVLHGFVLVMLSFWVTALYDKEPFVELIFVVGVLASVSVIVSITGIFRKASTDFFVDGELLTRTVAPDLWASVERVCAELNTSPPDQILAGIDDNFFVNEHITTTKSGRLTGRTLYVSLSLLRHFSVEEAEAIIAHEMAHFSGGDTLFSLHTAPLMASLDEYLNELKNVSTLFAYYLLNAFRALMELSFGKHSRAREFRADQIAVDMIGASHFASALLKFAAFSQYIAKLGREGLTIEVLESVTPLAEQIHDGYRAYARSSLFSDDFAKSSSPHPFDLHPLMAERLGRIGVFSEAEYGEVASRSPENGILRGDALLLLEQEQWAYHEARFQEARDHVLCYRYLPSNEEEARHVERLFPMQIFGQRSSNLGEDDADIVLRFDSVLIPQVSMEPIRFADIVDIQFLEDTQQIEVRSILQEEPYIARVSREYVVEIVHYYGRYENAQEWIARAENAPAPELEGGADEL